MNTRSHSPSHSYSLSQLVKLSPKENDKMTTPLPIAYYTENCSIILSNKENGKCCVKGVACL